MTGDSERAIKNLLDAFAQMPRVPLEGDLRIVGVDPNAAAVEYRHTHQLIHAKRDGASQDITYCAQPTLEVHLPSAYTTAPRVERPRGAAKVWNWTNLDSLPFDEHLFTPVRPGESSGLQYLPIQGEGVVVLRRPTHPQQILHVAVLELVSLLNLVLCR